MDVYIHAMISPAQRRHRIRELLEAHRPASQQELQELLAGEGIEATQATLSRDLRALGVAKSPRGYVLASPREAVEGNGRALQRTLQRELLSADHGGHTVVLRTRPGHANSLAIEIDGARLADVVGTIAGDDTVVVIARSAARARALVTRLRSGAGQH
jgi:transcriptional regulator of arginine metabolism